MSDSKSSRSGIGFFGLLGIVFITLKLCGVIEWPWWIVLSPLWGSFLAWLLLIPIAAALVITGKIKL